MPGALVVTRGGVSAPPRRHPPHRGRRHRKPRRLHDPTSRFDDGGTNVFNPWRRSLGMRLRTRNLLLLLAVVPLGLAGCSETASLPAEGKARAAGVGSSAANATLEVPEAVERTAEFGWAAAVGVPTTGLDIQFLTTNGAELKLGKGYGRLEVEVAWSCATPTCDLHAYLYDVDGRVAGHAVGASPILLGVEAPPAGAWVVAAHADSAAGDVLGTFTFRAHPAPAAPEQAGAEA